MPFSPSLVGILLLTICIARIFSTIGFIYFLKLICCYEKTHPNPLNFKELSFIWYAGLIRGAIAFGLVLRIDKSFAGRDLIVTTCLSLVLISTVLFGSTVGLIGSCLGLSASKEDEKKEEIEQQTENVEDLDEVSDSSSDASEMMHPNRMPTRISDVTPSPVFGSSSQATFP